jgi:hypothetical protein
MPFFILAMFIRVLALSVMSTKPDSHIESSLTEGPRHSRGVGVRRISGRASSESASALGATCVVVLHERAIRDFYGLNKDTIQSSWISYGLHPHIGANASVAGEEVASSSKLVFVSSDEKASRGESHVRSRRYCHSRRGTVRG